MEKERGNGVFFHHCITDDCPILVEFDDEPWCFTHSPNEGSSVVGFSARQALLDMVRLHINANITHNVFDKGVTNE